MMNDSASLCALSIDFGWNQVYGSQNHPSLLGSLGDFVVSAVKIPKIGKNKQRKQAIWSCFGWKPV